MAKLQNNSTIMITRANVTLPWQYRQTDRPMCRQDFQLNCYARSNGWLSETTQHEMTEHIYVHLTLLLAYINVSAQMDSVNVTGNAEVRSRKYQLLCFYNLFFMSVPLNYSLTLLLGMYLAFPFRFIFHIYTHRFFFTHDGVSSTADDLRTCRSETIKKPTWWLCTDQVNVWV